MVWRSVKQSNIADSTVEAEYIAACEAAKEAVWLKKFFTDLEVVPNMDKPIVLYCDNSGAVANSKEPRSHKRGKHIENSEDLWQLVFGRGFYGCVGSLELRGIGRTNSYGQLPTRVSLSALSQGRLRGVLLSTTCGVIGIEEFRRTTMLRLTLSFASFVMMSDFVFLVFRRLWIVLQTDQCVRDGPSPLIFYLMVG